MYASFSARTSIITAVFTANNACIRLACRGGSALGLGRLGRGLYIAERGKGAFLNDQRLRVAGRRRLDECVVACGLPHIGRGDHELALKEMAALQNKVAGFRRFGAASLDLAFVAAGRLDGYWERNLQPWDIAAGQIMVREAGGTISGMEGSDDPLKTGHVVCGNEYVHGELVKILKPLEK